MKRFKNILLYAAHNTDVAVSSKWALTLAKQNHPRLTVVDVVGQLPRDLLSAVTIMTSSDWSLPAPIAWDRYLNPPRTRAG